MYKDSELDRLGRVKDDAYEALKLARDNKNDLGKKCSKLHDELDAAYKAQNRAYEANQSAWEFHRRFMQDCSEKINFYKNESDNHHSNMVNAFQRASDAHNARDGAGAKSWANEGHRYQDMMRADKQQISYWVTQSKDAKYRFENDGHTADFERAKLLTSRLKEEFSEANSRYKPAKVLLEQKQAEFNKAKKAFDDRLNWLKNESTDRRRRLGAIILRGDGYKRIAQEKYYAQVGRDYQSGDKKSDVYVTVSSGWSRDYSMPTTDLIVRDKSIRGKHYHLVIGENGEELISEWRDDHN